jgi:regulator of protease activity HflC (stomatin/prohibitin superfamily)
MDFLSTILSWLEKAYDTITPFFVVKEYEGAVMLRFGRFLREVKPGPHWKWPLMDEVLTCEIATETISVKSQSLTTSDDKNIVVSAVIKYKIDQPSIYLIKVKDVANAIPDIAQGKIKSVIMSKKWAECREEGLDNEITKKVRHEANKWGISIDFVTLTDLAIIKSIRLIR